MAKKKSRNGSNNSSNNKSTGQESRVIKQIYVEEDGSTRKEVSGKILSEDELTEIAIEAETEREIKEAAEVENIPIVNINDIKIADKEEKDETDRDKARHINFVIRVVAVCVVFVSSMIFAAGMGVGLALWDSHKTMADLRGILFPTTVKAATLEDTYAGYDETDDGKALADSDSSNDVTEDVGVPKQTYIASEDKVDDGKESAKDNGEDADDSEVAAGDNKDDEPLEESSQPSEDDIFTDEIAGVNSVIKAGTDDELMNLNGKVAPQSYIDPTANYPLEFTSVDESYFTDALFIGDSRMAGFGLWSGLPATSYSAVGFQLYKYETANVVQTENGKVPIFEALPYDAFTKIYIKVGLNEMGWGNEEKFEALYAEFIAKLREQEPRAIIYIHGLLPVTAEKSATDGSHNNGNIEKRNAALEEFAVTQKAYFVNAGEAVMDANGCLPAEMTGDGIHMKAQYMPKWKNYLMEHAIVIK